MDDLISRQAAIDALDFEIVHMTTYCDGKNEGNPLAQYNKGLEDGKKAIEALPPAQPEPHEGEWINTNPEYKNGFYNNSYYCSECHDYYTTSPYEMKFCPNCGARMKGEQNERTD